MTASSSKAPAHTMRRSRWLALLLLIVGITLMSLGDKDIPSNTFGNLPEGSESRAVAEAVQGFEDEQSDNTAIAVFSNEQGINLKAIQPLAQDLGGQAVPSEDGKAALLLTTIEGGTSTEVANQVDAIRTQLQSNAPANTTVEVTGPAAIQADLANVFDGANFLLLGVTALIVAVLLIITYRSPVLWLIPLLVIAVADRLAATVFTWVLSGLGMSWDESTAGILSVLVFGAGTNYALLLISRYRDELREDSDRFSAMAKAWKPTARACAASASTVALGVLCLLLSAAPNTRGLGVASMVGVAIALLFALFVLPGALVTFDRWIFWPKAPKVGTKPEHKLWDKIGAFVASKKLAVIVGSLVILGIACAGSLNMKIGLGQAEQFIDTPESIAATDTLNEHFPDQAATPATVLIEDPAQGDATTAALKQAGATVRPGPVEDGVAVVYASGLDTETLRETVQQESLAALVGGPDAELYDQADFAAKDRMKIFPAVLAIVLVALMLLLRSVVAPLIMVATVLLTNVAAMGLGWWVFQHVLGFDSLAELTPLYAFVFLVALGVDYNIFLVTRAKEEAERNPSAGMEGHVRTALSTTGGVITSAGILLAAVFAALGVLPLVALAQIGVVIFLGVLLDTLIVRTILLPAVMMVLGQKFWWPAQPTNRSS
ncbi:MMPL family transporter [Corynebacterium gerontici]|uniref:Membrane protein YdfJ n=1 Tax=Corynebacterium gerontici TaxID=2079234 RepID=A0A3G6J5E6_9CORY|nr:MMPL family transporter [Corynebacterium gerontici]AZA11640.1 Membrane protein YdfJ [Corynebacterium gerontici]